MRSKHYQILACFLIPILILLGMAGCIPVTGGEANSTPHLQSCADANNTFYQRPKNLDIIVGSLGVISTDPAILRIQQADAISLLVHEVKKWSIQHDVQQKDVTYRFTVTLISPELILAIILAEDARLGQPTINAAAQLDQWMQERQTNQQIMFLLTVNSSDQDKITQPNQQSIYIPINHMTIETMSGLRTDQPQGEGMFKYNLDPYDSPIRYFFYFPIGVMDNKVCKALLDSERDLSFTLGISSVQINQTAIENLTWNFSLDRLINIGHETDPFPLPVDEVVSPDKVPVWLPGCKMPAASIKNGADSEASVAGDILYWMNFSFCVWDKVSGGH